MKVEVIVVNCPICGKEMKLGNVERKGTGGYDNKYIFMPEDYKKKSHKFKKILNKDDNRVRVNILNESTAWHCGECRKILMMADSDG